MKTNRQASKSQRKSRWVKPMLEQLEDRTLLSTIVWTNRGDATHDTDNFNATYGVNAAVARANVNQAITDWQNVIQNFNYQNVGTPGNVPVANTYYLTVEGTDFADGSRGSTSYTSIDKQGAVFASDITLDNDGGDDKSPAPANTSEAGWFFDSTPSDNEEFTSLTSRFRAGFTGSGAANTNNDFFRTIVHELGHAMGISLDSRIAVTTGGFLSAGGNDQVSGGQTLKIFNGATTHVTFTTIGGGHTYEGPVDPMFASEPIAPNDLMNAGRTVGGPPTERELITDLDAGILKDAYGYTITTPSTIQTFLAVFNNTNGVLTINGDPLTSNNIITVGRQGSNVTVNVDGVASTFAQSSVTKINVKTGNNNASVTLNFSNGDFVPSGGISVTGGTGSNSLSVLGRTNTWDITGNSSGDVNGTGNVVFSNIENLTGGSSDDGFIFTNAGFINGNVDGGGGTNTLVGDNLGDGFTVTGHNSGTLPGPIGGTFSNIENVTGGSGNDTFTFTNAGFVDGDVNGGAGTNTLVGDNLGDGFNVTGHNSGTLPGPIGGTFANIENLTGGSGNDTFSFTNAGFIDGNVDGGAGTDTLVGDNLGDTFNVTGAGSGTLPGPIGGTFANIENLTGGTGNDSFLFANGGSIAGNVDGGTGTNTLQGDNLGDTFTVTGHNSGTLPGPIGGTFSNIENLTGGSGNDSFTFTNAGFIDGNVDGGSGNNTLVGDNLGDGFNVTGHNSGTLPGPIGGIFANIENLTGGSGNDTFTFTNAGFVDGDVNGGAGTNTLVGDNLGDGFNVTGHNSGTLPGPIGGTFANIENLTGGSGNDTFSFTNAGFIDGNVDGGAGTDTLVGDNLGDTFNVTGAGSGTLPGPIGGTFANIENLTGGTGNDSFLFANGGSIAGNVDGGTGTNTLQGDNLGDTFTVTGHNSGTLPGPIGGTFSNIQNLTGGSGNDTFSFTNAGFIDGNVDGRAGTDTLVGDNLGDVFTVTGAGSGTLANKIGGTFANIENFTGGSGADSFTFANAGSIAGNVDGGAGTDTLIGDNLGDVFTVTGAGSGTLAVKIGGTFANIENLTGGSGNDSFTFANAGSIAGNVDGGAGTDTLVGDNLGDVFTVTGAGSGTLAVKIGGTFANIENLTGGSGNDRFVFTNAGSIAGNVDGGAGTDTLIGDNLGDVFTVTGVGSGTLAVKIGGTFANIENLTGGSGNDSFTFANAGSIAGSVDGGAGTDTLVGDNLGDVFTVTGAGSGTLAVKIGGTFANIENLTGGSGNDSFAFANAGSIAGNVDGGAGTDTLVGDNLGDVFTVTGAGSGTLAVKIGGTFANIENLTGGSGNDKFFFTNSGAITGNVDGGAGTDTLIGDNLGDVFTVTGAGSGTLAVKIGGAFANIENLTGGSGNDRFVFTNAGSIAGNVEGAGGVNTLVGDDLGDVFTVKTLNAGTLGVKIGGAFANIQNLTGGAANDVFVFANQAAVDGTVDGGGGNNYLDFSAYLTSLVTTLLGFGTLDGFLGTMTGIGRGFNNIGNIFGGSAPDVITGLNQVSTWYIGVVGDDSIYSSGGRLLGFRRFETINGGTAANTFNVYGVSVPFTLNGNSGQDVFNVVQVDRIKSSLTFNGNVPGDKAVVNAGADTAPEVVSVTATNIGAVVGDRFFAPGGFLNYYGLAELALFGGSGGNAVNLYSKTPGMALDLNTGLGNDVITAFVNRASAYANVLVNGEAGNDLLNVIDTVGGAVMHNVIGGPGFGDVTTCYLTGSESFIDYEAISQVVINPDANHSYVQTLYHQFLQRDGSMAELNGWVALLNQTHDLSKVSNAILRSEEARDLLVKGWYAKYMGRAAVGGEEGGWVQLLLNGQTEENVLSTLLNSQEYYARAGNNDAVFVQQLFHDILGRDASSVEVSAWLRTLDSQVGRGGTARLLFNSVESRSDVIRDIYDHELGRAERPADGVRFPGLFERAEPSENDVLAAVFSGLDLTGLRAGFASTKEFYDRAC